MLTVPGGLTECERDLIRAPPNEERDRAKAPGAQKERVALEGSTSVASECPI
jgi:hypothetical protein